MKIYYKTTKSEDVCVVKVTGMDLIEITKRFGTNIAHCYFAGPHYDVRSDGSLAMTFDAPVALGNGIRYLDRKHDDIFISKQDTEAHIWLLKPGDTITKQAFNKIVKFLHRCSSELRMLIDFEENSPIKIVTIP